MRLRTAIHRTGIAALTAGLTAAGVLALPTPASAASDVTATLRVTTSSGDSVVAYVSQSEPVRYCTLNVTVGVTTEIRVKASKGASIQVWPSNHCYDALHPIFRIPVDRDGQVIELKL